MGSELEELTAVQQRDLLRTGEISPLELVDCYLQRITTPRDVAGDAAGDVASYAVGAFITVTADAARRRARMLRGALPAGERPTARLWGLPSADKDLWQRAGVRTTFGSRVFADFVPETSDEIVRVLEDAGTISLGKTNTPEFGMTSYAETLVAPPARNPWNPQLSAGGSSGGAAAAVAAGLLPFAPGSDGGGSIRIPAAACGLVGVKPSRGRVPADGSTTSLGGLTVAGSIGRTVADAALLLDGMIHPHLDTNVSANAGLVQHHDALRAPGSDGPYLDVVAQVSADAATRPLHVGVMTTSAWDDDADIALDDDALRALHIAADACKAAGHAVGPVSLVPDASYAPAFEQVWQAGAASLPVEGAALDLVEPLTAWLIDRGRALTPGQVGEASAALHAYERSFIAQLSAFDVVLTPATALTPRPIGWYDAADGAHNFAQQVQYTPYTSMVNVAGLPAIVVPVLLTADGLPMGVQLIGRPGGEQTLFALATQLELRLPWQHAHPPLW